MDRPKKVWRVAELSFSGLSVAMDGHSQAHKDVLVACPEKDGFAALRSTN